VPFATHEYPKTQVHCCCDALDVVTASSVAKHGTGSARCACRPAFGQLVAPFEAGASTFSLSYYRHLNLRFCRLSAISLPLQFKEGFTGARTAALRLQPPFRHLDSAHCPSQLSRARPYASTGIPRWLGACTRRLLRRWSRGGTRKSCAVPPPMRIDANMQCRGVTRVVQCFAGVLLEVGWGWLRNLRACGASSTAKRGASNWYKSADGAAQPPSNSILHRDSVGRSYLRMLIPRSRLVEVPVSLQFASCLNGRASMSFK
jgi:hypothetical protein